MGRVSKKDSVDSKILKSNIFETQQEAEYAREKLKVEDELQEFSRLFVPGKELEDFIRHFETSLKSSGIVQLLAREHFILKMNQRQ